MPVSPKPNVHIAPLDNSVVFKKLFSDPDVLREFVKDLLGLDLQITASQIETEKKFTPPVGNVDIAYDIFVDDPKNRIIIEIQRVRYPDHYDRFFYYFLVAIIELIKSYQSYHMKRTVYTIVWLTRKVQDKKFQECILTNQFETKNTQDEIVKIYPHKLIFLNPNYVDKNTPKGVADWMNLVLESLNNPINPELNYEREIFHKATDIIADEGINPTELAEIINETVYEQYVRSNWEKGRQEGIEEGIELGQVQLLHRLLFSQLAQKFTDIPEHILAQIEQTNNVMLLEMWLTQIASANSWQELFEE
ncbi:MAG: PD-(D/E)XK nuclease family transposase [Chloroflexota bacterium]